MSSRKFALSGAHGTGKTTLLAMLSDLGGVGDVLPEVPRVLVGLLGADDALRREHNRFDRQLSLIAAQMGYEGCRCASGPDLWTDRTVLDHWAYTELLFPDQSSSPEGRIVRDGAMRWSGTYRCVFYLRPEFDPEDDGVREGDQEFQRLVDERLSGLYEEAGLATVALTGSPDARLNQILDHLEDL